MWWKRYKPEEPYRLRVDVRQLDGSILWTTNPSRFQTEEDAHVVAMLYAQWGIRMSDGEIIPPSRIHSCRVIDTREEGVV